MGTRAALPALRLFLLEVPASGWVRAAVRQPVAVPGQAAVSVAGKAG